VSASPACLKQATFLCNGKDCRKDDGHSELRAALLPLGRVKRVKCQDLCGGPVAGVEIDGRVEWFEKVRKPRQRQAVVALATGSISKVPVELRSSWARKRGGKIKGASR
jgi:hypothetical protein